MKYLKHSLICTCIFLLAACTPGGTDDPQARKLSPDLLEWVKTGEKEANLTPFERKVIEDYWVSDSEWAEAKDLFYECMAEHGLEGLLGDEEFGIGVTEADQDKIAAEYADRDQGLEAANNIALACSQGNINFIGIPYFEARNNPLGLGEYDAIRKCFEQNDLKDLTRLSDEELGTVLTDYEFFTYDYSMIEYCVHTGIYTID